MLSQSLVSNRTSPDREGQENQRQRSGKKDNDGPGKDGRKNGKGPPQPFQVELPRQVLKDSCEKQEQPVHLWDRGLGLPRVFKLSLSSRS
jgi:hypothetical protein